MQNNHGTTEQIEIKDWFNKTYTSRAFQYLRPVDAYQIYLSLLNVEENNALLDVACGPGQMLKSALQAKLKIAGLDISDVAIDLAKDALPNADLRCGNAENLPFPDNNFNYITCLGSLERIINLNKALQEIRRVGSDDARFCFLVRNAERASWKFVKQKLGLINKKGHQGAKTYDEWRNIFLKEGFKIEKVHHDQWPKTRWFRWLSLNNRLFKVDYAKVVPSIEPINTAYEFIFILSKA